jgi:biopolymer transport protein ExbB
MIIKDILTNGGPTIWPLIVISILSMTVILERAYYWLCFNYRYHDENLYNEIIDLVTIGNYKEALKKSENSRSPIISLIHKGLGRGLTYFEETIEVSAKLILKKMNKGLGILDAIVTIAPLLGILGTVLGIIDSFDFLGDIGLKDPKLITKGISQALISTAAGLMVAIFSLVLLNLFKSFSLEKIRQIEIITGDISLLIKVRENEESKAHVS